MQRFCYPESVHKSSVQPTSLNIPCHIQQLCWWHFQCIHLCAQSVWPFPTCTGIIGLLSLDHGASHLNIYLCSTGAVGWWALLEQCQQGIKEVFCTTLINTLHVTCTSVLSSAHGYAWCMTNLLRVKTPARPDNGQLRRRPLNCLAIS